MDVKIYQVNIFRDDKCVAFVSLDMLPAFQHSAEINSSIYDKVFDGTVDAPCLEGIYQIFNHQHPEGYRGRSMSVSDVVEVVDGNGADYKIKPGFYYCDSFGFKEIVFHPELTTDATEKSANVCAFDGRE